jgi:hypothetical protein
VVELFRVDLPLGTGFSLSFESQVCQQRLTLPLSVVVSTYEMLLVVHAHTSETRAVANVYVLDPNHPSFCRPFKVVASPKFALSAHNIDASCRLFFACNWLAESCIIHLCLCYILFWVETIVCLISRTDTCQKVWYLSGPAHLK